MNNAKKPNPDDALIGHNIRTRRLALGLSQEKLGEAVGVTFQQIQKYEKGSNRVGGSRLIQIAGALQTTAASLMPAETITSETSGPGPSVFAIRLALQIETLPDSKRQAVANLVRALANEPATAAA